MMNEKTNARLSKKIFAVGKVYDTALMTDQEIEDAVQKDRFQHPYRTGYDFPGFHKIYRVLRAEEYRYGQRYD